MTDTSGRTGELPLDPELLTRLTSYLTESVAVVDGEGRVLKLLGPPGGILGLDRVIGRHIFDYCLPEDLPHALDLAVEALESSPGWSSTWHSRLGTTEDDAVPVEIFIENRTDDPVIGGFVLRLRVRSTDNPVGRELARELESLAGGVPLPIAFVGSDSHLYYLNDALRAFVADRVDEVERDGIGVLAIGEERETVDQTIAELLHHPGERTVVFTSYSGDGLVRRMIEARFTGLGKGSQVLALFVTLVDVTKRYDEESELRRQVASDLLTGLSNRMSIEAMIAERLGRNPVSVGTCYLDLDGFKSVNDTNGHQAGDEFLVAVARILTNEVREHDVVGRLGGDEFAIVVDLSSVDASSAGEHLGELGRRIARSIAGYSAAGGYQVTASVGIAIGRDGDAARDVLRRADHAMYEEKRSRPRGVHGACV